jgi:predicted TIM-barrel fold metal-dependent hydrolase
VTKTYFVVDTDIHPAPDPKRITEFLPEPWRTRYESGNRGPGHLGYWNPNGYMRSDTLLPDGVRIEESPAALAKHFFDEFGIHYGILNPEYSLSVALSPEAEFAASLTSATNDVFVHDWLPVDERFRGSIMVQLADPQLAAKEIHRLGDHPQICQVLTTSASHLPLGNRYFHPIYAAAVEHDLPVAIHPGLEGLGISGAPTAAGYPSNYLEWHTGLVTSYIAQLVSLVTEGVFQKFPTLKFILIEGGVSWLPAVMWRFDKNWKALRSTAPWLDRPPSEVIREHVLLTTQPMEEPENARHYRAILDMFDAGHMLMFSSDFPHWDGDTPDFSARAFPQEIQARVMGETAREIYRLPELQHA